jgi:hypothetical protein
MIRSMASSIEARFLDPMLDLVWKTGLQHASATDPVLANAVGQEMYGALHARRRELIKRPLTFQANGISSLLERQSMLRAMMQLFQIIGSNELLLQAFLQKADMGKLVSKLFELGGVPLDSLQLTDRERMLQSVQQPLMQAQQQADQAGAKPAKGPGAGGSGAGGGAQREMASVAADMGAARG